jgi:hypothetical protein
MRCESRRSSACAQQLEAIADDSQLAELQAALHALEADTTVLQPSVVPADLAPVEGVDPGSISQEFKRIRAHAQAITIAANSLPQPHDALRPLRFRRSSWCAGRRQRGGEGGDPGLK